MSAGEKAAAFAVLDTRHLINGAHQPSVAPLKADALLDRLRVVAEYFSSIPELPSGAALLSRGRAGDAAVRLVGEHLSVGRDAGCDLSFPAQWEMSRRHFEIWHVGSRYVLRDTRSSNGTMVRGYPRRIGLRDLCDGDLIEAGGVTFLFTRPD